MKRTRLTLGIVLACLCLPPLIIGGLLKAGHYTLVAKTLPPWRCQWYLGPTDVMVNYRPVRGYRLTLNKYDLAAYRPQDVPIYHRHYIISALVLDRQRHGICEVFLEVHDLTGQEAYDPTNKLCLSNEPGLVSRGVASQGPYDVVVNQHGYLPIKKRVQVGPKGAFVRFILPRVPHVGRPSHKPPANARS